MSSVGSVVERLQGVRSEVEAAGLALVGVASLGVVFVGQPVGWRHMRWVDEGGNLLIGPGRLAEACSSRWIGEDAEGTRWHGLRVSLWGAASALFFDRRPLEARAAREAAHDRLQPPFVATTSAHAVPLDLADYPGGVLELELDGRVRWANAPAGLLFGRGRPRLVGQRLEDLLAEPRDRELLGFLQHACRSGRAGRAPTPWGNGLGGTSDVRVLRGGDVMVALFDDATDRERAIRGLRQTSQWLHLAQRTARAGVFRWSPDRNELSGNAPLAEVVGAPVDRRPIPVGEILDRIPAGRAAELVRAIDSYRVGQETTAEFELWDPKQGRHRHLRAIGGPSAGVAGDREVVGMLFDVTELRQLEAAERARSREVQLLVASAQGLLEAAPGADLPEAILDQAERLFPTHQGLGLAWEGAGGVEGTWRVSPGAPVERYAPELPPGQLLDAACEGLKSGADEGYHGMLPGALQGTGSICAGLVGSEHASGVLWALIEAEDHPSPAVVEGFCAQAAAVIGRWQAVERLRLAEESYRAVERLDLLGRLAAGLAHDLNNLLTVVEANLGLLRDSPRLERGDHECLDQMGLASRRAARLTRQMLGIGRRRLLAPEPCQLDQVLAGSEAILRALSRPGVQVEVAPSDGPVWVNADEDSLVGVLVNLVSNAIQAVGPAGRVRISIDAVDIEGGTPGGPSAGSYGVIRVEDDGSGLSGEDLRRVFDPFFTTRAAGTGLGLAASLGAIRHQGGTIRVRSAPGVGSSFEVLLPTVQPGWEAARSGPALEERGLRVLAVGSDRAMLRYVSRLLTGDGHEVRPYRNGMTALRSLEREPAVDLLITEGHLADLGAMQLASRVQARTGPCGVIVLAEYPQQVRPGPAVDGVRILEKPFDGEALFAAIASVGLTAGPMASAPRASEASSVQ